MNAVFTDFAEKAREADRQTWLGRLAWFSVESHTIRHDTLKAELKKDGLERFCPKEPRDDDVFRRIFYNGQRRHVPTDNPDIFERLLVREVVRAEGRIVKRIVIETVNSSDESLGFREAVNLTYVSDSPGQIGIDYIGGAENTRGWDLAAELSGEFESLRGCVDARAVREVVRQVLASASATSVRPGGGVYFVPPAHGELLDALESTASRLPGCTLHTLPLVSEKKQADMLRAAFETESIEAVNETMAEISGLLASDRKVSMRKFTALATRHRTLVDRTKEYSDLLEQTLESTDDRLHILGLEMTELMKRAEA